MSATEFNTPLNWEDSQENSPPSWWEAQAQDGRWYFFSNYDVTFGDTRVSRIAGAFTTSAAVTVEWEVLEPMMDSPTANIEVYGLGGDGGVRTFPGNVTGSGSFEIPAGTEVSYFEVAAYSELFSYGGVVALRFVAAQCTLPNLVGMTQAQATSALEGAGFELGEVTEEESEETAGTVLTQDPAAGTMACGSVVGLTVSGGACDACFDVGALCTSPLSDLLNDVLEEVPQASDPQVESAIRDVTIDFLKRTKLLHFDHPAISLVAGQSAYALQNPCDFQIMHIRSGTIDGKPILQTSEEQLDLEWQALSKGFGWRYQFSESPSNCPVDDWRLAESERPGLFYQLNPNEVRLVGIPTVAVTDALLLKVVVMPMRGITALPRWIFHTWHQAIVDGAIGKLKLMADKPWSDRQAAGINMDDYNSAVGEATATGLRGFKRNDRPLIRTKSWD